MTDPEDLEDAVLLAEVERRLANDSGIRFTFDDVLERSGLSREVLDDPDPWGSIRDTRDKEAP